MPVTEMQRSRFLLWQGDGRGLTMLIPLPWRCACARLRRGSAGWGTFQSSRRHLNLGPAQIHLWQLFVTARDCAIGPVANGCSLSGRRDRLAQALRARIKIGPVYQIRSPLGTDLGICSIGPLAPRARSRTTATPSRAGAYESQERASS